MNMQIVLKRQVRAWVEISEKGAQESGQKL